MTTLAIFTIATPDVEKCPDCRCFRFRMMMVVRRRKRDEQRKVM